MNSLMIVCWDLDWVMDWVRDLVVGVLVCPHPHLRPRQRGRRHRHQPPHEARHAGQCRAQAGGGGWAAGSKDPPLQILNGVPQEEEGAVSESGLAGGEEACLATFGHLWVGG